MFSLSSDAHLSGPASEKSSALFWITFASLVFGIISGLRLPNIWSATHFLFDYSAGFIKRGLLGELLAPLLGDSVSYSVLACLSYGIFALWLAMFFFRLRAIASFDRRIWLFTAVFLLSPGFVFLVHEIGYFDHVGLIVVFLCFLMPTNWTGLIGRILLSVTMVFVHETFFVLLFPTVVIEYWVRAELSGRHHVFIRMLFLTLPAALAAIVMVQMTLPEERQDTYIEHIQSRAADFTIRPTAVKVLFRDSGTNLALNAEFWSKHKVWVQAAAAVLFLLPFSCILVIICWGLLYRTNVTSRTKLLLGAGVAAASLSPVFLNIIAWDLWRFFALTQVSSFLVLVATAGAVRSTLVPSRYSTLAAYGFAVFAVLGASTITPLFDYYVAEKPPYVSLIHHIVDVIQGDVPWFTIPSR